MTRWNEPAWSEKASIAIFALLFVQQGCNEVDENFGYHKVLKRSPILLFLVCSFLLDKNQKIFKNVLVHNWSLTDIVLVSQDMERQFLRLKKFEEIKCFSFFYLVKPLDGSLDGREIQ